MPWESVQQARWGHSPSGLKALGGAKKVAEWDAATPKGSLPRRKMKDGGPVMAAHGADEVRYANPKGYRGVPVSMAAGGPVLGRARSFEKPDGKVDEFSGGRMPVPFSTPAKQEYGAKGAPAKRTGDKSERAVKPRT